MYRFERLEVWKKAMDFCEHSVKTLALPIPHFRKDKFVIPECFYRESRRVLMGSGFPLKTCGNDMCKTCLPNIYMNFCELIYQKTKNQNPITSN